MANEHGIANIETVVGFFCGIGVDVEASLADGKFNIPGDLVRFLDDAMKIPGLVKALPTVDDEFLDLSAEEAIAVEDFVRGKLNLPQADVTEVVTSAIAVMLSTSATVAKVKILVEKIKALKHQEATKVVPPKK